MTAGIEVSDRGQQAGPALFQQPIALTADGNDVAVMEESVEDGGGDDGSVDTLNPATDRHRKSSHHGEGHAVHPENTSPCAVYCRECVGFGLNS